MTQKLFFFFLCLPSMISKSIFRVGFFLGGGAKKEVQCCKTQIFCDIPKFYGRLPSLPLPGSDYQGNRRVYPPQHRRNRRSLNVPAVCWGKPTTFEQNWLPSPGEEEKCNWSNLSVPAAGGGAGGGCGRLLSPSAPSEQRPRAPGRGGVGTGWAA